MTDLNALHAEIDDLRTILASYKVALQVERERAHRAETALAELTHEVEQLRWDAAHRDMGSEPR